MSRIDSNKYIPYQYKIRIVMVSSFTEVCICINTLHNEMNSYLGTVIHIEFRVRGVKARGDSKLRPSLPNVGSLWSTFAVVKDFGPISYCICQLVTNSLLYCM